MPQRTTATLGAPCWIDLATSDKDASRAFYDELFGWTSEDLGDEFGGYVNFRKDGRLVAGAMGNSGQFGPDTWSLYLASDDARATADAAVAHGGQVLMPAMEVLDLGSMAFVSDAGQAAIGIWQPGRHQGFEVLAETGAPAWFELHTRDYDASVAFYRTVFGWDARPMSDTPEFRYTTLGEGDAAAAGIMDAAAFLPEGEPASWSTYFGVDDTDAALTRAVELGGKVLAPAMDSPYGRLAQVADPTGATFKVVAGP